MKVNLALAARSCRKANLRFTILILNLRVLNKEEVEHSPEIIKEAKAKFHKWNLKTTGLEEFDPKVFSEYIKGICKTTHSL